MTTVSLSISLGLLQFLLVTFCIFQCIHLAHILSDFSQILHIFEVINGISQAPIHNCYLLIERNNVDFCILILYSATLINSLIVNFFCRFHWIFSINNHIISEQRYFPFFLSYMNECLYFLSFYITLTRISSTMLARSDESKNLALFLILGRKP